MTEPRVICVLGTDWQILFRRENEDPKLKQCNGYTDNTRSLIVVEIPEADEMSVGDLEKYQKKVLRHEIIHAFLMESGLECNSFATESWADNEEMVDWFAIQSPKIFRVFEELNLM